MFYKKTGKIPNKHSKPNRHSTKTTETAFADKEIIYGINTIQVLINTDPSRIISIFCEKKNTTVINSKIKNICDLALDQQISVQDTNTATFLAANDNSNAARSPAPPAPIITISNFLLTILCDWLLSFAIRSLPVYLI